MKKIITFLLACVMIFACGMVVACDTSHTHDFSADWSSDATYHWHACKVSGCSEKADLAQHDTLGENQSCSVCGRANGTEEIIGSEVNKDQWDVAVAIEKFSNVTITYSYTTQMGYTESEMLVTSDKVYRKNSNPSMSVGYIGEMAQQQKDSVLGLFIHMITKYESFTFNAEDGTYDSTEEITYTSSVEGGMSVVEKMSNAKIKFNSDYTIASLDCTLAESIYMNGNLVHSAVYEDMAFKFKNFGTTVVDFKTETPYIPQANYTQVSEEQWISSMKIENDCEVLQTMTLFNNGDFYYVMDDHFIRSGNVIKFADWYISIDGDKYYQYYFETDKWVKEECDEYDYISNATFRELLNAFDSVTFDSATGLYVCEEVEVEGGQVYSNFKAGFVDGKLAYVYYEDRSGAPYQVAVFQCYFTYKTVSLVLPSVAE
jgi:hypothetical protein